MKRITNWPQFVLGLAFSWGALMGWAAAFGELAMPAVLLYCGAILWTIGYDTIYSVILYRAAKLNPQKTSTPISHSISGDCREES